MFSKIIFTSFDVPDKSMDYPGPKLGYPYKATKLNGMWHVLLEDDVSLFVPGNGKAAWFTAEFYEISGEEVKEQDDPLDPLFDDLASIITQDVFMTDGLALLLQHVASTYNDKYEEAMPMVDNTWLKYGPGKFPAGHNIGQAVNYLKRYLSEGFEKSYNVDDLKKAAHMILFELARRDNEV